MYLGLELIFTGEALPISLEGLSVGISPVRGNSNTVEEYLTLSIKRISSGMKSVS